MNLPGYTVYHEQIYTGSNTLLFNGIRDFDKKDIFIKVLRNRYPSPEEILRFRQEYEIAKLFQNEKHIVHVYALEKYENSYAMIMEKIHAPTLSNLLKQEKKINLDHFFELAIAITKALGILHQKNIIHKDITPSNILYDSNTHTVKLIDFSLSATLPKEHVEIISPNVLDGTLAYISPEQTGRMNRSIDYRADFYSLGVTFYHLLVGNIPFKADDPMKMVHSHIAIVPKPPEEFGIPPVISNIVMKLISKKAEDRYQNANGLLADLKNCAQQFLTNQKIEPFVLGTMDIFSRFRIPEKLYGRDTEVHTLMSTYQQVIQGDVKLMLVAGYSGIGKTSLVHEVHKPIAAQHGYFITGKFEQLKQNIPYSSVIEAFKDLIKQVLTEPEERIAPFRNRILNALKGNGEVMVNLIPNLVSVIGKQPAIPELGATENLNRLSFTLQNFIKSIATEDSPLVIFLDDLQWADLPSLKILEILLTSSDCRYLFIIGAYRNNEVNAGHPLTFVLENLKKQHVYYESIHLGPLSLETTTQLIADTLYQDPFIVQELAKICYEKALGNPFFLIQLLLNLYKEQFIEFDAEKNQWTWHIAQIKGKKIADNVVQLMVNNIGELSLATQKIMQFAALIGNKFDLDLLSQLCDRESEIVLMDLQGALNEGYIIPYKSHIFYFAHDRIQQAAYSMIDDQQRYVIHIKLAHLLLENTAKEKIHEVLFTLVNHYNIALTLGIFDGITPKEKKHIAQLNLQACQMAKEAAAFEPALKYAQIGIRCVNEEYWLTDYDLIYALYTEATLCSHLSLKFELMETYAEKALKHSRNILDEIKIVQIQILSNVLQMKQPIAVALVLQMLRRTGITLPHKPNMLQVFKYLIRTKFLLIGKNIPDLINLPTMTDDTQKAIVKILASVYSATYQTQPNLFPILVCLTLELSIKHGNTIGSSATYVLYGLILCGVLEQINIGYQFGELGVQLAEKLYDLENKTKVIWSNNTFIKHWKDPIHDYLLRFIDNYHIGISEGDIEFSCYSIAIHLHYGFLIGYPLKELVRKINNYKSQLEKSIVPNNYTSIGHQAALNMIQQTPSPELLVGEVYDETKMLKALLDSNDESALFILYSFKSILAFHFEKYTEAIDFLRIGESYKNGLLSSYQLNMLYYYKALTLLSVYDSTSYKEKWTTSFIIRFILKKFKKWKKFAPENYAHKYLLIQAEFQLHVKKNNIKASSLYDEAIHLARKNAFLNDEALANELAAKFYFSQGREKIALVYMKDAKHCYQLWGAEAKIAQLDTRYPELFRDNKTPIDPILVSSSLSGIESLDISTIQKSSAAISSTIVLSSLLKKLMYILIENAGAQRSYLLLNQKGKFTIEAQGHVHQEANVLQSIIPTENILPMTLINYVINSKEFVVLNNAIRSDYYLHDPYIISQKPLSVLVLPLINQAKLTGILYLENNLIEGAFTEDRIRILNLLSSQIAISIDNARLYENSKALNTSFGRFVPEDFLSLLKKKSILDVVLGDHVQETMTVLFCDIRNFTTLSEKMTPEENFEFINSFLKIMGPIIRKHHGFVDKYIGDAIMAIYPDHADDALDCSLEMQYALEDFNTQILEQNAIKIGIGINTGSLMLGTVGEEHRMSATAMSDAVNIASRVESLTKVYNIPILITEATYQKLTDPAKYDLQKVDSVILQGKTYAITIYKVLKKDIG